MKKYNYLIPHGVVLVFTVLLLLLMTVQMLGHNPQGEFQDFETGEYHFDAILPILGMWVAIIFLLIWLPMTLLQFISINAARKNEPKGKTTAKKVVAILSVLVLIIWVYSSVAVL